MENRAPVRRDNETAKVAVQIRKEPGAPVVTRRERNLERAQLHSLPVIEFVHDAKPEIVHQISHSHGHDNRLIRGYAPQRAPVEMIKMSVSHEDEID